MSFFYLLWMQGRCSRENCKYLHPPSHLKTQLEINGRNNLIQQKTAAAVLAQQMQLMIPGHGLQPMVRSWFKTKFCFCCVVVFVWFVISSRVIANISCYAGTWHKYWSRLWFVHNTTEPWNEPYSLRHPLQHSSTCFWEPVCHSPVLLLLVFIFIFISLTEASTYRQTWGIYAPQAMN